ncbi:hypothetical protein M885DRAFT_612479 [Pelagophyceae sp. CCMP2097]|nr:hypothetical protein M885DRAFT_612479 [Pelagophyceae sp. CCMP2097]
MRLAWCVLVEDGAEAVGALAAGGSLRATGSAADLVALVDDPVRGAKARETGEADAPPTPCRATLPCDAQALRAGGWKLIRAPARWRLLTLAHRRSIPCTARVRRPVTTPRALHAATLALELAARFDRVAVLEAHTLALEAVDELFRCDKLLCAVHDGAARAPFDAPLVMNLRLRDGESTSLLRHWLGGDDGDAFFDCGWLDPLDARTAGAGGDDGRCARLPFRYGARPLWLLLNGDRRDATRLVRAANAPPPRFAEMRRARLVHLALGPARPWHWWAAPVMPLATLWRAALRRAAPAATPAAARRASRSRARLGVACAGPWVVVGALAVLRWGRRRAREDRPPKGPRADRPPKGPRARSRFADVAAGQLALLGGGALGAYAARGHAAGAAWGAWRLGQGDLFGSPAAGACVFYSTAAATAVALQAAYLCCCAGEAAPPRRRTAVEAALLGSAVVGAALLPLWPLPHVARALSPPGGAPDPSSIVDAAVPLAVALVVLAVVAPLAALRLGELHRAAARPVAVDDKRQQ